MANAELKEVEVMVPVKKQGVFLELSEEEAAAVVAMTVHVGGMPDITRRGLIDNVRHALNSAGIYDDGNDVREGGAIYFTQVPQ